MKTWQVDVFYVGGIDHYEKVTDESYDETGLLIDFEDESGVFKDVMYPLGSLYKAVSSERGVIGVELDRSKKGFTIVKGEL